LGALSDDRSTGVQEYRRQETGDRRQETGVQENRSAGMLKCWSVGVFTDFRAVLILRCP